MKKESRIDWIKVDNAGKIYPASKRSNWTALFRVSATLTEKVDPQILQRAQENAFRRFPMFAVRLKRGIFWYYLQHIDDCPDLQLDVQNPCVRMNLRDNKGFMIRVRYFDKTVAVEIFHVLSDGTGGMSFLLTLVAEYLKLKYGENIPRDKTILDCTETVKENEIEDAFLKYSRKEYMSRKEPDSYYIRGTRERADNIHTITGIMSVEQVKGKAAQLKVSLGEYLAAVMVKAVLNIQKREKHGKLDPVKVSVPVSLRRFYPETNTKRNFASYVNVGVEPRLGEYELPEIARAVHHQMGLENTEKMMNSKFSTNVHSEDMMIVRILPLTIKNFAMKMVFNMVGDRKTSTTVSNLGNIKLPDAMAKYVERIDFLVGPLSRNKIVCGVVSYNGTMYFNSVRTIAESKLEQEFFTLLVKEGIHVKIESNNVYVKEDSL